MVNWRQKEMDKKPRALCAGGGGQAGSRSGGQLYRKNNFYDLAVGTSVGALTACLVHNPEKLKEAGTTTRNSHIWKTRGVGKKDQPNWPVFFWRLARGKASWGNSSRLINRIRDLYTRQDHERYLLLKKEIVVCVWDHTEERIKYFSNQDVQDYDDFTVYVFASMSAPPGMNKVVDPRNENLIEDGGVAEVLPLEHTVELAHKAGITHIDAYVHQSKSQVFGIRDKGKPKNHVHAAMRALKSLSRENLANDIKAGLKRAEELKVNVWIYYLPSDDIKPRFYFDPKIQQKWFNRLPYTADAHIFNQSKQPAK